MITRGTPPFRKPPYGKQPPFVSFLHTSMSVYISLLICKRVFIGSHTIITISLKCVPIFFIRIMISDIEGKYIHTDQNYNQHANISSQRLHRQQLHLTMAVSPCLDMASQNMTSDTERLNLHKKTKTLPYD